MSSTYLYTADSSGNVVIPSDPAITVINQYDVDTGVVHLTFATPCYITTICEYAFSDAASSIYISLSSVILPASLTSIDDFAFYYCPNLTTISIPNLVTSIGQYAFGRCGLTEVVFVINSSCTNIGAYAFYDCSSLTTITIPASVTSLGIAAFLSCDLLTSITIPSTIINVYELEYTFYSCTNLATINISNNTNITCIGPGAFHGCTSLKSLTIPSSITSIDATAFTGCTDLIIHLNGSSGKYLVDHVGNITASYDGSIGQLDIPLFITSIDSSTFINCSGLTSIFIPNTVTSISANAFLSCTGLTYIIIPSTLSGDSGNWGLGAGAGAGAGANIWSIDYSASSISIPGFVTYIPAYAFYNNTHLTSIMFHSGILGIEEFAFYGCSALSTVDLSGSHCSHIDDFAFDGCTVLGSIAIPNTVTVIGDYAFAGCSGLSSVSFNSPCQLTTFGSCQFVECTSLTGITLPSSITSISDYAFQSCAGLTSITFAGTVTSIGIKAFNGCTTLGSVDLNSCTHIGERAFEGCSALGNVTFSNALTNIDYGAFVSCTSFTSITIPTLVKTIGDFAFYGDSNVTTITFTSTSSCVSIGDGAFASCTKLASCVLPDSVIEIANDLFSGDASLNAQPFSSTTSNVKRIGKNAFLGTKVLSLTVSDKLTTIDLISFDSTNNTTIYITSTSSLLSRYNPPLYVTVVRAGGSGGGSVPCFLKGTRILTSGRGYVLIEELTRSDKLLNHLGKKMNVLDVSSFMCEKNRDTHPYLIPSGCRIGSSYKCIDDLYLSPRHEILIENQFTAVNILNELFNQVDDLNKDCSYYEYYHITTDNYFTDVIMSNGIPSESFGMHMCMNMDKRFISGLMKRVHCDDGVSRKLLTTVKFMLWLDEFRRASIEEHKRLH